MKFHLQTELSIVIYCEIIIATCNASTQIFPDKLDQVIK